MSDLIEEISELEAMVAEEAPEEKPDRSAIFTSTIGYEIAIVVLDVITAGTVGVLTYWWYGGVWFLAGAISFFLHQKNWKTAGNNDEQNKISSSGMIVSVVMMLAMAVVAGTLLVFRVVSPWVEAGIIAAVVCAFFWHGFRLAMYVFKDDDWIIANQVARAIANAEKKIKIANAGGTVVAKTEQARKLRHAQYKKHGDRGAVDAAIDKIAPRNHNRPAQPIARQNPSLPMPAMAQTGKAERLTGTGAPMGDLGHNSPPTYHPVDYDLARFLIAIDQTADGARAMLKQYGLDTADKAWQALKEYKVLPSNLARENFNRLYAELAENRVNPTTREREK